MKLRAAAVLVLVLASAQAFAQEPAHLLSPRILLSVTGAEGSSFSDGDLLLVARSLLQRLQEGVPEVVFLEGGVSTSASSPEELTAAAESAGADGWLRVTLGGDWSSARLRVRAFDMRLRSAVADVYAQRSGWGSPSGLAQEAWGEVVQSVSGKFPMREAGTASPVAAARVMLTIRAEPGSIITGLGAPALRVGADGTTFRMLTPRREYVFRTEHAGYLPVHTRVYLAADRQVTVEQRPQPTWGLEGSLVDARAPGMDVSVYFPSYALFARAGFSTYALGFALDSDGFLLEDPLTVLGAQFGAYLSPQDRFFRFYLAVGGFVRLVHASGTWPVLDALAPAGFRLVVGVESPVSARGTLYFELTPSYYQTSQPDALHATLGQDNTPGWLFGSAQALELLSFRVGYRWRP